LPVEPAQRNRNESEKPTITLIAVSEPLRNSSVMRSAGFASSPMVRLRTPLPRRTVEPESKALHLAA